ncbi:hypothetical protein [Rubrivivax gelatinosus]|uniref:hypothetical protein n=1 Tax=Rubrivivax gelatinosus TaxID=28068 RepID=UPI001ED90289|nr:hypothetical protein [Rubrivivax gelatinosus]
MPARTRSAPRSSTPSATPCSGSGPVVVTGRPASRSRRSKPAWKAAKPWASKRSSACTSGAATAASARGALASPSSSCRQA